MQYRVNHDGHVDWKDALIASRLSVLRPNGCHHRSHPTRIYSHTIASRLLAEQEKLKNAAILEVEVKRMLADSSSNRFVAHFVEQWLGLDGMESVTHVTDDALKDAMRNEPVAFFEDLLKRNASVFDFIHSDYALVNER